MLMEQSCLSTFFRGRRRTSTNTKKKPSHESNLWSHENLLPSEQCLQTRDPTDVVDEKGYNGGQTWSRGFSHRPRTASTNSATKFDNLIDDIAQRSYPKWHKPSDSPMTPFNETCKGSQYRSPRPATSYKTEDKASIHHRTSNWLRRCVSTTLRHPRRLSVTSHHGPSFQVDYPTSPVPGIGIEPPRIPDDMMSGAAARAAAATHNEILESVRNLRLAERKISRDSESGIGIEMRDRGDESIDVPIPRKDPVHQLPEELVVQILSYLDAGSLIEAELVSRKWYSSASSHHVWKHIFQAEFGKVRRGAHTPSVQYPVGGPGLGKILPDQDWKTMWRARKALHQRWQDGHAAAIYLEGHTDSVYCVQFDEHKILTGSRDRTIRVWDAHTYECIEVLGVPSRNPPAPVTPLPDTTVGRGHRPFTKTISPQTTIAPPKIPPALYHDGSILCLQYNDSVMITGSSDCTCIVWDLTSGYHPIRRLRHHNAGVLDVCFDAKYIVSCSKDTTVCLWDQTTGDFLRQLSGHRGPVNAVQLRGDLVVSASGDGVAKLWNLTSGLCIKEFPSKDRGMACVEFSADSRTVLAGGNDQVIYQFDTTTGELVRELHGHRGLVRSLHLDSVNGRVVSGSYDHSVKAYDLASGETLVDFWGWTTSWILSAKADYRRIVATSQDSRAVVMDFGFGLPGVGLLEEG